MSDRGARWRCVIDLGSTTGDSLISVQEAGLVRGKEGRRIDLPAPAPADPDFVPWSTDSHILLLALVFEYRESCGL